MAQKRIILSFYQLCKKIRWWVLMLMQSCLFSMEFLIFRRFCSVCRTVADNFLTLQRVVSIQLPELFQKITKKNCKLRGICFPVVIDTKCRFTRHITSHRYRAESQPRYPASIFTWRVNLAEKAIWNWMPSGWQEFAVLKPEPWKCDSSLNVTATEYFESLKSIYWPLFNRILCTNLEIVIWFFLNME